MKEPMSKGKKPAAKIKVSQSTIDSIKKMGMTKALAGAKSANPEMKEALTRMYGARRVSAAATPAKAAPRGAMVDMGGTKKAASRTRVGTPFGQAGSAKATPPAKKKSTTTDPFAKAVFGITGALGRTLSVEPRVTAAQAKKNLEAKKRAAANKNK
jgi:hypothetical protein